MLLQSGIKHSCVFEQIGVGQIVPFTAWETQSTCRSIAETLQRVVHENLLVIHAVVGSRKLKPSSSRRVVGRIWIVLSFECEGLNNCGIARLSEGFNR